MTKANKLNAISTLIIGDEELVNDELIFKDLSSRNQSKVNIGKIKEFIFRENLSELAVEEINLSSKPEQISKSAKTNLRKNF